MALGGVDSGHLREVAEEPDPKGDREPAAPRQFVDADVFTIDEGVLEGREPLGIDGAREVITGQRLVPIDRALVAGRIRAEGCVVEVGTVVDGVGRDDDGEVAGGCDCQSSIAGVGPAAGLLGWLGLLALGLVRRRRSVNARKGAEPVPVQIMTMLDLG